MLTVPAADPALWRLEKDVVYLNHGAFGACPGEVLDFQQSLREQLEREPVRFFLRELEPLLDAARESLAAFVGADAQNLVFVPNATAGVNTVLRSLKFAPGDELLLTDHEYNASRNALEFVATQCGARVITARVPFPIEAAGQVIEAVMGAVTQRTRLVLLDHVTSQTGLIFPIAELVGRLAERGIECLIDGAHAPGMIALELEKLGAAFYTGNCHKWLCAPKGAGFLYVRPDFQEAVRPLIISHGANSARRDRSRFLIEMSWTGTGDFSAFLSVPKALEWMEGRLAGGWSAVMARNRALALAARRALCAALEIAAPAPESMIGALAAIPLPPACVPYGGPLFLDPLQEALWSEHAVEVPIIGWPAWPARVLRVSAQLYNGLPQYEALAGMLSKRRGE